MIMFQEKFLILKYFQEVNLKFWMINIILYMLYKIYAVNVDYFVILVCAVLKVAVKKDAQKCNLKF